MGNLYKLYKMISMLKQIRKAIYKNQSIYHARCISKLHGVKHMFSLPENSGLHQIFKEFCKCRSMRFVFSHGAKDLFHKVLINVKILIQGEARLFATIWFCMAGSYLKFQFSCSLLSKCRSYLCAACTLFKNNVSFLYTRLNSGNYPCFFLLS